MDSKKKKILIIGAEVQPIPPVKGGAVEYLVDFLLQENEQRCFADITVASPYDIEAIEESKKYRNSNFIFIDNLNSIKAKIVNFIDLFSRKFFNKTSGIYYIKRINKIIKYDDYDLVVVENRPLFGKIIRKKYKGNLFLHLHNDFINKETKLVNEIDEYFNKYIVVSNYIKKQLSEVSSKVIDVVYNGIDLDEFNANNKSIDFQKTITYSGRIVEQKGVLELVKAFNALTYNDISLNIIGNYDFGAKNESHYITQLNKEINKNKRINYLGYVPYDRISKYYASSYIGVIPSIVNEALPLTAIEMIASGLPVICTDAGGLPEIIDDSCGIIISRDGLETNISKSLTKILNDDSFRSYLSNNAPIKAKLFSKEKYIQKMISILLE